MKNEHEESKKLFLSLLVGGVIGAGVLYFVQRTQHHETPVIKKIGKTISEIGGMLENSPLSNPSEIIDTIKQKVPKESDIFGNITDWVNSGLNLWKKFKKE